MPEVIQLHRATVVEPEAAHAACDLPPVYGAGPDIGEDYEPDVHAPSRGILRALGITAVAVLAGLLLAHWGAR